MHPDRATSVSYELNGATPLVMRRCYRAVSDPQGARTAAGRHIADSLARLDLVMLTSLAVCVAAQLLFQLFYRDIERGKCSACSCVRRHGYPEPTAGVATTSAAANFPRVSIGNLLVPEAAQECRDSHRTCWQPPLASFTSRKAEKRVAQSRQLAYGFGLGSWPSIGANVQGRPESLGPTRAEQRG